MNKVSKIFHISDIHIRNFKRHSEYRRVFNKLYDYIEKNKDEGSIIYLGGDIVHSKNEITPELIELTSSFLNKCASILPTVLIAGNHDANLANASRLDTLTAIVKTVDNPNLHYYRDSGVYDFRNIKFSVFSVFGDESEWVPASNIKLTDSFDHKIVLYHGIVNGCRNENGEVMDLPGQELSIFNGFDYGLLGDIHTCQTLSNYKIEHKEIDEEELEKYLDKGWEINYE